jgi:hypothetical protein
MQRGHARWLRRKRRNIGIHFHAAQAIQEYIEKAGAHFRRLVSMPLKLARSEKLGAEPVTPWTMWAVIGSYLERLPGASKEIVRPDVITHKECVYTPHSLQLRATTTVRTIQTKSSLGA